MFVTEIQKKKKKAIATLQNLSSLCARDISSLSGFPFTRYAYWKLS